MAISIIQDLILNRGNDLTEFFWPIFYYIKQSILIYHQIPLWNNLFFAGTPLLPDPQNPTWYLPNIVFLFVNIDTAILMSLTLHYIFGAFGAYIASRNLNFSRKTALTMAIVYSLSPIYFSFVEAGHWGLIIFWAWIPYLILAAERVVHKPNLKWVIIFAAAASSIYFNHVLSALVAFMAIGIYWLTQKSFRWILSAVALTGIIIFPAFFFQYTWQSQTTRNLLLKFPETYPLWLGKVEFIKSFFVFNPTTEKAITFGIIPSFIACLGFLKLKKSKKFIVLGIILLLLLIVLNNVSPIYSLLLKINFFVLMRVATRVWFIAYLILLYLFGLGLERLNKNLFLVVAICVSLELLVIDISYLVKPISQKQHLPSEIYSLLAKDKQIFRIFCTTRCISQKEAATWNLHLADGYGTLQQQNYFKAAMQIGQYYWNRYSLEIPPSSIYLYNKLQPYAPSLSDYAVKYVISTYPLSDKNLKSVAKSGQYIIFENTLFKPLNYLEYSPNLIEIDNADEKEQVTVPEIYNSGWKAYGGNGKELEVFETRDYTIGIKTRKSTIVILKFEPYADIPNLLKLLNPYVK